jgi:hypothetical protein
MANLVTGASGPNLQDEFQYRDGVGFVSVRALARMLGVSHTSIVRDGAIGSEKLGKSLATTGFLPGAIAEWPAKGIPDAACAVIAEHFAFDARTPTVQARQFFKLTSAAGIRTWIREKCKGLDSKWIQARTDSKRIRHPFTQALQEHGCEGRDMAVITDNNNLLVTGKRAKQIVAARAPGTKASGRSLMTTCELSMTTVLEATQTAQIGLLKPRGGDQCLAVCSSAGMAVMELMTKPMENIFGLSPASPSSTNSSAYRVVTASDF